MPMLFAYLNGSIKSDNVKATYDGSKWSTAKTVNYSPTYQYYAYYPYSTSGLANLGTSSSKGSIAASGTQALAPRGSSNAQMNSGAQTPATRAVSANTSASDFFASGISAFTPATNQSTAANFNASDLQVGKATINRLDATDIDFTAMSHAMGMAKITLGTKSVPKEKTFYLSNDNSYTWSAPDESDMTTVTATATAFSGSIPYNKGGVYYMIGNTGKDATATSTGTDGWTLTVKPSAANSVTSYTAQSKRTTVVVSDRKSFTLAIGDIYYTDGAVTHSITHIDNYHSEIYPIGIVGYIGQNYWTEYNTGSGHGGHALVMCLRNVGANGISTDIGQGYMWKADITDDGRTKEHSRQAITTSQDQEYSSGYIETKALYDDSHPALKAASDYKTLVAPADKSTGWFLPSSGQVYGVLNNYGYTSTWSWNVFDASSVTASSGITDALSTAANGSGYTEFFQGINAWLWTSSEYVTSSAVMLDSGVDDSQAIGAFRIRNDSGASKNANQIMVRPFLAF